MKKTFADIMQNFQKDLVGYLKTNAAPDYTFTSVNANYNIKINNSGKSAWATYDQTTMDKDGKTLYLSHEIRCLENVSGAWKVVVLSAHHYKP